MHEQGITFYWEGGFDRKPWANGWDVLKIMPANKTKYEINLKDT